MKGRLFYISLVAVLLFSMIIPTHIQPVSAQLPEPETDQIFLAFPQSKEVKPGDLNVIFDYYYSIVTPMLEGAKNADELSAFTPDMQRFGVFLDNPRIGLVEELNAIIQHAPLPLEKNQEPGPIEVSDSKLLSEVKSDINVLSETKALSSGHLRAHLFRNYIYYYSNSIDYVNPISIDYEVERDENTIASGTISCTDFCYIELRDSSDSSIYLAPGDIITITEGDNVNTQTIPSFIAMANPYDDIIKGNTIASANIIISFYDDIQMIYKEYNVTTDSLGTFSKELDYDLLSGKYIDLNLTDPISENEIALSFSSSNFNVYVNSSNYMWGESGKAGEVHSFLMSIYDQDNNFIRSVLVDCDHEGYFSKSIGTMRSGMTVKFEYPTGEIYQYKIPDMLIDHDITTEEVFVKFLPSTNLDLSIRDLETNTWDYYEFTTDDKGEFTVLLSEFDLSPEDYGFVYHYLDDNNSIRYFFRVPYIRVDLTQSVLFATLDPDISVQIKLYSSTDLLKESRSVLTSSTGYFGYSFPTMIPGDYFVLEFQDKIYTIPVSDFSFTATASTDTVAGKTFPNALVSIYISKYNGYYSYSDYFYTVADENGYFSIDVSQDPYLYDILPGAYIRLNISTGLIYKYEKYKYLPHRIDIFDWSDSVSVSTTGNVPITITLKNSTGSIIGSSSGTTSKYGYFSTRGLGDIAPGNTVIVTADGVTKETLVKPLGLTEINRATDKLVGFGSPGELLYFRVGNDVYTTIPDSEGNFILDLAGQKNVKGRETITVVSGNYNVRQLFQTTIPYMEVDLTLNRVSGRSIPNTTLVMYLKDSLGNLKEMRQTTAEGSSYYSSVDGYYYYGDEGYYYVYFQSPILEGDILELHTANQVFILKVDNVSLDMDKISDVISGTAPAKTYLYFYAYNNETSYDTYLAADENGEYSLDISNNLDLNNLSYGYIDLLFPEGDLITDYNRIPGIGVNFQNNSVWGYGLPSSNTDIQLLNDSGSLIATQNVNTYSQGNYYLDGFCNSENTTAIFNYNYYLKETENNITTQIPVLTAYFDKINNKIVGDGPADKNITISYRNWKPDLGYYDYFRYYLTTNADGSFEIPVNTIHDYDYAVIQLTDDDGNRMEFTINLVDMTSISTAITAYPTSVTPNTIFDVSWSANSGNGKLLSTHLHYDTISHACDHNYRYYGGWGQSSINLTSINATAAGKIYIASSIQVGGIMVWGPEVIIEVEDIEPTLVEPVSGTTSLNLPVIRGYAPAGSTVSLYDGSILIATGISDENGYFEITLSSPLSDGLHILSISSTKEVKSTIRETIELTVNSSLIVDPNNIFFIDRGQAMRIKDPIGLANLGGKIWIRPNSTVIADIPMTCTNPTEVKLNVNGNITSLLNSGDNRFSGSFFVGSEDVNISVSAKCDGITKTQFLADVIVDSGGYVFDTTSGNRLSGVKILAYVLNELTNTWKIWDGLTFGQPNPTYSDSDGYFRFIAPTGTYKLEVLGMGGYNAFITPEISVLDKPLQYNIELIQLPEKLYLPMINR